MSEDASPTQGQDSEDTYRMRYFGRRWNAPAFDDAIEVDTPLGATCLFCTELVDEHDDGILQNAFLENGHVLAPIHIECHLRSILGCVAHLEHRCSCYRTTNTAEHDGTSRAAARAVLDWVITHQTSQGIPNPGFHP